MFEVAAALRIGLGGASGVANKTVKIYERVKVQGKWTDRPVSIPKLKPMARCTSKRTMEGGSTFLGTRGKNKKWHPKTCTTLSDALKVKAEKEWPAGEAVGN